MSSGPATSPLRRGLTRAGEGALGALLVARTGLMGLLALLLVVAGVWTSWETAEPAMFSTVRERGTMTVEKCADHVCRGSFTPVNDLHAPPERVTLGQLPAPGIGERTRVALRPGTDEVVRTGPAGVLYAWLPLAGALLLAVPVVAAGLRLRRTAWGLGLLGAGIMGLAFALL